MTTDHLDWKSKIIPRIKEILLERRARGILKASIRGIFYILVSLNMMANTKGAYKGLSRALVTARERGIIPDDWIVDQSRSIIDIDDEYLSPEKLIDNLLGYFDELPEDYKDKIPKWHRQQVYVEIWIKKKAMAAVFKSILDPVGVEKEEMRQVRIIPNSGWSSRTFWIDNANRLIRRSKLQLGKVVVLYFGDYDPSGNKMVKKLKKMLEAYGIDYEAVAITKKQIRQFGLEHLKNTDPAVLAKLKCDTNKNEFIRENNGQLFQIELDALEALRPDDLRDLLLKM
jgi:5S rRNA maturation endonuclease (ribonuclease M5)